MEKSHSEEQMKCSCKKSQIKVQIYIYIPYFLYRLLDMWLQFHCTIQIQYNETD